MLDFYCQKTSKEQLKFSAETEFTINDRSIYTKPEIPWCRVKALNQLVTIPIQLAIH